MNEEKEKHSPENFLQRFCSLNRNFCKNISDELSNTKTLPL